MTFVLGFIYFVACGWLTLLMPPHAPYWKLLLMHMALTPPPIIYTVMVLVLSDDTCFSQDSNQLGVANTIACIVVLSLSIVAAPLSHPFALGLRAIFAARVIEIEGDLPARLRDGTIRLVDIAWLLNLPPGHGILRRQELSESAFVPVERAVHMLQQGKVAALSYRWLSRGHPDPNIFHLRALQAVLSKWPGSSMLPAGLLWDFASLPQKDADGYRSDEDERVFKSGLRCMASVYASPRVLVLQHRMLPEGAKDGDGMDLVPYGGVDAPPLPERSTAPGTRSGWCTFEEAVASLATAEGGRLYEIGVGWRAVRADTRCSPAAMRTIFEDPATYFFGSADRTSVGDMYAHLHEKMVAYDNQHGRGFHQVAEEVMTMEGPKYGCSRIKIFVLLPMSVLSLGLALAVSLQIYQILIVFGGIALTPFAIMCIPSPSVQLHLRAIARGVPRHMRTHGMRCSLWAPPLWQRSMRDHDLAARP